MKKWGIIVLVGLVVLMAGLAVVYRALISRDYLVSKIESSINSRVQIGGLKADVFSWPAKVAITEVIIAERDEAARQGVPHDQREKIRSGEIEVEEIRFDLSLAELFSREIDVSELMIRGARFDLVMDETGALNIEERFGSPPEAVDEPKDRASLNALKSQEFVTSLERFVIEGGSFRLRIEKTGLEIVGEEVHVDLSDIRVDPKALEKVNEAHLEFAAQFAAFSGDGDRLKYGQLGLSGPARVRLFDPIIGDLSPDAEIDFVISPDSYVSARTPYLVKIWEVTRKLSEVGLSAKPLPSRLTFGRGRILNASYSRNRVELHAPVSLVMSDWELAVDGGSWVEPGTEQHASGVRLIAGAKVSDFVDDHLEKVTSIVPRELREDLIGDIRGQVFVGDRLTLKVATRGPLSSPGIELMTRLPKVEGKAREYAKDKLLDYALDKLLK